MHMHLIMTIYTMHSWYQVCGADGVTYDNVCVLRAQSANARVDFTGECTANPGESPADFCERVIEEGRCTHNTSNCDHLVSLEEGCCPLCGKDL